MRFIELTYLDCFGDRKKYMVNIEKIFCIYSTTVISTVGPSPREENYIGLSENHCNHWKVEQTPEEILKLIQEAYKNE